MKENLESTNGSLLLKQMIVGMMATHVVLVLILMILLPFDLIDGIFKYSDNPPPLYKAELSLLALLFVGALLIMPMVAGMQWLFVYPGLWVYLKFKGLVINKNRNEP